jgi:hypothetical protein
MLNRYATRHNNKYFTTVSLLSLLLIRMENSTGPQAVFDICR